MSFWVRILAGRVFNLVLGCVYGLFGVLFWFFVAHSALLYFAIFSVRVVFFLSDLHVIFTSASWLLAK